MSQRRALRRARRASTTRAVSPRASAGGSTPRWRRRRMAASTGSRVAARLVESGECTRVVGIDTARGDVTGVTWRRADVRDPTLRTKLAGVETVVHLANDRRPDAAPIERRIVNVRGTENVIAAAAAADVTRVVLLTSAM